MTSPIEDENDNSAYTGNDLWPKTSYGHGYDHACENLADNLRLKRRYESVPRNLNTNNLRL